MSIVLCFSGGIASGKTSLANRVAERLGLPSASFGSFVRSIAKARGTSEDRSSLQALGEALIEELGWDAFCRAVLDSAGWKPGSSIVVDGIRHLSALNTLRAIVAPIATRLVFVDVPLDVRQERAEHRSQEGTDVAKADAHSTEKDVRDVLREMADLVVDGTRDPSSLLNDVQRFFAH